MASGETTNTFCGQCHKGRGTFKCQGCEHLFCFKHAADHRNELGKEFEEIIGLYNTFQPTLTQQMEESHLRPIFEEIDLWEKQSISEIRQQAEEKRESLRRRLKERTARIQQRFKTISVQLRDGREENDFLENDLKLWREKLEQLTREMSTSINRRGTSDLFERLSGNGRIASNGQMIIKEGPMEHAEFRGKNEYATGQHDLCFRVKKFLPSQWLLIGIITQSEPLRKDSYNSSSTYGCSNRGEIYQGHTGAAGKTFEIIEGDLLVLSIDCDRRKILLENERTNSTMEMSIDLSKCPFPWQLHLNLYHPDTCLRILNSDDLTKL